MNAMRAVVLSALVVPVLAMSSTAGDNVRPDQLIGLLALPQLFGNGPCDRFEAHSLTLYASLDGGTVIGEVRVDAPWTFHDVGGCAGLEIGVHLEASGGIATPLPIREYGYEEPGAIVLAKKGDRFKIKLEGGAAWVAPRADARFHPVETLVADRLSYLTEAWSGTVCDAPGQPGTCRRVDPGAEREPGVTVLGHRRIDGALWFRVEVPARETCGGAEPSVPPIRGWISGHDSEGKPAIWFHSRGC